MSLIGWIILGGVAGWAAGRLMGGGVKPGLLRNIALGMIGSVVGGLVFNFFGGAGVTGFNVYSFGVALVGSMVTLVVGRKLFA